jgi:hypothetical protein
LRRFSPHYGNRLRRERDFRKPKIEPERGVRPSPVLREFRDVCRPCLVLVAQEFHLDVARSSMSPPTLAVPSRLPGALVAFRVPAHLGKRHQGEPKPVSRRKKAWQDAADRLKVASVLRASSSVR